jgi:hypothetical protein
MGALNEIEDDREALQEVLDQLQDRVACCTASDAAQFQCELLARNLRGYLERDGRPCAGCAASPAPKGFQEVDASADTRTLKTLAEAGAAWKAASTWVLLLYLRQLIDELRARLD